MKTKLLTLLSLLLFLFLISNVSASITVPTQANLGIPNYGTYISFEESRTLSTLYRSSNTWTIDDYGFTVQNSNLTINELFDDTPQSIELDLSAPSGGYSIFSIDTSAIDSTWIAHADLPTGATSKTEAYASGVNTFTTYHTVPITYVLTYSPYSSPSAPGGGGTSIIVPEDDDDDDFDGSLPQWSIFDEEGEEDDLVVLRTRVVIIVCVVAVIIAIVWYDRSHKR